MLQDLSTRLQELTQLCRERAAGVGRGFSLALGDRRYVGLLLTLSAMGLRTIQTQTAQTILVLKLKKTVRAVA